MEALFETSKAELIWRCSYQTRRNVEIAAFDHVKDYFNPRRILSAPGWKSPLSFRKNAAQMSIGGKTKAGQVQTDQSFKAFITLAATVIHLK